MIISLSAEDLHLAIITPGLPWILLLRLLTFSISMSLIFSSFFYQTICFIHCILILRFRQTSIYYI